MSCEVATLLWFASIDPWRNSTPIFGAVAFCTININDFRTPLTCTSSTKSSTGWADLCHSQDWKLTMKMTQKKRKTFDGRWPSMKDDNEDALKNKEDLHIAVRHTAPDIFRFAVFFYSKFVMSPIFWTDIYFWPNFSGPKFIGRRSEFRETLGLGLEFQYVGCQDQVLVSVLTEFLYQDKSWYGSRLKLCFKTSLGLGLV